MGFADKQNESVAQYLRPQLTEGETLAAVVGLVMRGPSLYWWFLSPLVSFMDKPFALAVTDRRLFVIRLARKMTSYPPAEIVATYPLGQVRVNRFSRGTISGRLVLEVGQPKPLDYRVQTVYRDSAEQVANAIGSGGATPPPGEG